MKKIAILVLLSLISFSFWAQNNKSIVPIITQTSDYIQLIEQNYEKQIVLIQYDVIISEKEVFRQLFANAQYGIIVVPDDNLSDVNIEVQQVIDNEWVTIEDDLTAEGVAMVYFTPTETGVYRFFITSTHLVDNDFGFYSLIIFR
ncbi:MAG: hypothetical protein JXR68_01670 [Bacteroidales bacterium]|nr:hypothetical protein [Bacteroidales bacterium]